MIVRYVTVEVTNPGALSVNQTGSVTVDGCASAGSAAFEYAAEQNITAEVSGEVASIRAQERGTSIASSCFLKKPHLSLTQTWPGYGATASPRRRA